MNNFIFFSRKRSYRNRNLYKMDCIAYTLTRARIFAIAIGSKCTHLSVCIATKDIPYIKQRQHEIAVIWWLREREKKEYLQNAITEIWFGNILDEKQANEREKRTTKSVETHRKHFLQQHQHQYSSSSVYLIDFETKVNQWLNTLTSESWTHSHSVRIWKER